MDSIQYRTLHEKEIDRTMFSGFLRHQVVTKCWRKVEGQWVIKDDPFVDDWDEGDYEERIVNLIEIVRSGGLVYGAFHMGRLKGFVSVENRIFGGENRYLDLTNIHVSEDMRGRGIGTVLFHEVRKWAKQHGAKMLYISAHSAVESQSFYRRFGCCEAKEYSRIHAEKEPCDCQLECDV